MKAGLECDALVATNVMGLESFVEENGDVIVVDQNLKTYFPGTNNKQGFAPSTRIQDAWMVVEKLKEMGYRIDIININSENNAFVQSGIAKVGDWRVYINSHEKNIYKTHESAPLAICLASLKALGAEVN